MRGVVQETAVGASKLGGKLEFYTTADGAASPTKRLEIDNTGSTTFSNLGATTGNAVSITADSLTTGSALSVSSASTDASNVRSVAAISATASAGSMKVQTLTLVQKATSSATATAFNKPAAALAIESTIPESIFVHDATHTALWMEYASSSEDSCAGKWVQYAERAHRLRIHSQQPAAAQRSCAIFKAALEKAPGPAPVSPRSMEGACL